MTKNPLIQYFRLIGKHDYCIIFIYPLILTMTIVVIIAILNGNIANVLLMLLDVIPTLSSIILGFLGMIAIATISPVLIFDRMKEIQYRNTGHSLFNLFFKGIYANLIIEVVLLFESIIIGLINSAFHLEYNFNLFFSALIIFTLMSSTFLFMNNMNRIYHSTTFYNQ